MEMGYNGSPRARRLRLLVARRDATAAPRDGGGGGGLIIVLLEPTRHRG